MQKQRCSCSASPLNPEERCASFEVSFPARTKLDVPSTPLFARFFPRGCRNTPRAQAGAGRGGTRTHTQRVLGGSGWRLPAAVHGAARPPAALESATPRAAAFMGRWGGGRPGGGPRRGCACRRGGGCRRYTWPRRAGGQRPREPPPPASSGSGVPFLQAGVLTCRLKHLLLNLEPRSRFQNYNA